MSVRVRPQQLDSRYAIILPLEDIRSFLEAPGGVQSHAIVGPGYTWSFRSVREKDDDYLAVWFYPGASKITRLIHWSITGRSSRGTQYFKASSTYSFTPHTMRRGWRYLLSRKKHWEESQELREENCIILHAECHISGPIRRLLHHTIVKQDSCVDLRFIVFPRRSKSGNDVGRLVDPQALGGNMDDLRGECSTLYHCERMVSSRVSMFNLTKLVGLTNSDAPQDIMQVSDGLSTEIDRSHSIDVSYLDDDSDFEDEDDCEEIMNPFTVDRKVRALLNKLTDTQFVPISNQLIAWANKSEIESDGRTLIHIIRLVFEKAMNEPMYTGLYARLCRTMMEQISPGVQDEQIRDAAGAPIPGGHLFRKCLLIRCQGDFERGFETRDTGKIDLFSSTYYAAKQRGLGLIKFIGELFKLQMLTERIMHECIKKLLGNVEDPDERDLESLCMLLTTVGQLIDTPQARPHMDVYFDRMQGLCTNPNVTLRMQFVLEVCPIRVGVLGV